MAEKNGIYEDISFWKANYVQYILFKKTEYIAYQEINND